MDKEMMKILKEIQAMSFEEIIERMIYKDRFFLMSEPIMITSANIDDRREVVYKRLKSLDIVIFNPKIHKAGEKDYDMVFIRDINNPTHLYEVLRDHNHKIIIFDTDKILKSQWYINKLQGAVCSSPNSGIRWRVLINNYKMFDFKGATLIITDMNLKEMKKKKHLEYILRDTLNHL